MTWRRTISPAVAGAVMLGLLVPGPTVSGASVERTDCIVEAEPNDTLADAVELGAALCVSGELVETADVDVFLWDVDDEAAAATWSVQLEGVSSAGATASVVRIGAEGGTGSDAAGLPGAEVARVDAGAAMETASGDVGLRVDEGRYAVFVSRDTAEDVAPGSEVGYELRLIASDAPAGTEATRGRITLIVPDDARVPLGDVAVELLLDTSGSMLQPLDGATKLAIARATLVELIDQMPTGLPVALRTFRAKPKSCATVLRVPLEPLRPKQMKRTIRDVPSRKGSRTPIAKAILEVPGDLAAAQGHRIIVLVTDGKEDCGGDPAAAIAEVVDAGYTASVDIVGYALPDDAALRQDLASWAELGGGRYLDAPDGRALSEALRSTITPPYLVFDGDDRLVAQGRVGDGGVEVEASVYRVEVLSDPPSTFERVEVGAGAEIELPLDPGTGLEE